MESIKKYEEYMNKIGDRYNLFKLLNENFSISTASYPGSYIDITPSIFFPTTYYIDLDKKAKKFFSRKTEIIDYIHHKKVYEDEINLSFFSEDYRVKIDDIQCSSDLLISLYAGFVSKYCKDYLKKNGLLLANNSHGDASMAQLDGEFTIIGVIDYQNETYYLKNENLDEYFIPKKKIIVNEELLEKINRGIKYTKPANYYLFRKTT